MIDKIFALIENFWSLITEVPKFRVFFSFGLIVLALLLGLIVVLWRFSHTSQSNASSLNLDDETPEDDDIFASSTNYHDEINIQQSLQDEWLNENQDYIPALTEGDDFESQLGQKIELSEPVYQKKDVYVPFDWNKDISKKQAKLNADVDESLLSYHAESKSVKELAFLIIDMICRGVDDAKIVQTINFRTQGKECPFDILQMVSAVRKFMKFCVEGKFFALKEYDPSLPDADEALFHLAKGDSSLALLLMQADLQFLLDKAQAQDAEGKEKIRIAILKDVLTLAALAEIDNLDMALEALNLVVDLAPDNPVILSRIADINLKKGNIHQAASIYSQILEAAKSYPISPDIIANAQFKSAQYFGHSKPEANIWKRESLAFFARAELNQKLSPQEIKVVNLIEAKGDKDIEKLILRFFMQKKRIKL